MYILDLTARSLAFLGDEDRAASTIALRSVCMRKMLRIRHANSFCHFHLHIYFSWYHPHLHTGLQIPPTFPHLRTALQVSSHTPHHLDIIPSVRALHRPKLLPLLALPIQRLLHISITRTDAPQQSLIAASGCIAALIEHLSTVFLKSFLGLRSLILRP